MKWPRGQDNQKKSTPALVEFRKRKYLTKSGFKTEHY